MVNIATFLQTVAKIRLMASEQKRFTDGLTDDRATTIALLTQSSKAYENKNS